MERLFAVALGLFLLFGGLQGLITGETPGWKSEPQGSRAMVSWRTDPVTYVIFVAIYFAGGAALIWHGVTGRGGRIRP